jgi:hypothetical protein
LARGRQGRIVLARMVSTSLQCGTPLEEVVRSLKGLNYPPHGAVVGSQFVSGCCSVADWVARELEVAYLTPPTTSGKVMDMRDKGPGW